MAAYPARPHLDPAGAAIARLHARGIDVAEATVRAAWTAVVRPDLELRIGRRLADRLTDDELDAFEVILEEEASAVWLAEHVPAYRCIASEEIEHAIDGVVRWFAARRAAEGGEG